MERKVGDPAFDLIFTGYLNSASPGRTFGAVLAGASDRSFGAPQMVEVLDHNQAYAHFLLSLGLVAPKLAEWDQDEGATLGRNRVYLERLTALLGKSPIRNLVGCMRLARLSDALLPTKPGKSPALSPREQLRYALAAEDYCLEREWVASDLAYQAGLHYDWIVALAVARKAPPEVRASVADGFAEGLLLARSAVAIGQKLPVFALGKYAFASALLIPLGKSLMTAMYPKALGDRSWAQCATDITKLGAYGGWMQEVLETRQFACTHAEMSFEMIQALGFIPEIASAVCASLHPYDLKPSSPDLYQLASVLNLAGVVAGEAGKSGSGPKLAPFQQDWLKTNGLVDSDIRGIGLA